MQSEITGYRHITQLYKCRKGASESLGSRKRQAIRFAVSGGEATSDLSKPSPFAKDWLE